MKLYATVTSERATKGQGGNKELIIEIKAEKLNGIPTRVNVYRLHIANVGGELYASLLDYLTGELKELLPKGKQQKGEDLDVAFKRINADER